MFRWFTWAKFAGWCAIAAGVITSPLIAGIAGAAAAAKLVAVGTILTGISSLVTTKKAGTATDANGDQINGQLPR